MQDKLFTTPQSTVHSNVVDDHRTALVVGTRVTDTVSEGVITDIQDSDGYAVVTVTFSDGDDTYRTAYDGHYDVCGDVEAVR